MGLDDSRQLAIAGLPAQLGLQEVGAALQAGGRHAQQRRAALQHGGQPLGVAAERALQPVHGRLDRAAAVAEHLGPPEHQLPRLLRSQRALQRRQVVPQRPRAAGQQGRRLGHKRRPLRRRHPQLVVKPAQHRHRGAGARGDAQGIVQQQAPDVGWVWQLRADRLQPVGHVAGRHRQHSGSCHLGAAQQGRQAGVLGRTLAGLLLPPHMRRNVRLDQLPVLLSRGRKADHTLAPALSNAVQELRRLQARQPVAAAPGKGGRQAGQRRLLVAAKHCRQAARVLVCIRGAQPLLLPQPGLQLGLPLGCMPAAAPATVAAAAASTSAGAARGRHHCAARLPTARRPLLLQAGGRGCEQAGRQAMGRGAGGGRWPRVSWAVQQPCSHLPRT